MHHTCASPPLSLYAAVMLHNVLGKAQMFSLLKVKILHGPDRILHSTVAGFSLKRGSVAQRHAEKWATPSFP